MNIQSSTVLITGASGGIGGALAKQLAAKGAKVLVSGRDADALNKLCGEVRSAGGSATAIQADLGDDASIQRMAQAASSAGAPDIVIHCAGALSFGAFENESADTIHRLWQTNVMAPMLLTRALLPSLRLRRAARLVFVGSIFGSIGFPLYSVYSATKYALRGFAQALRRELEGSGIGVTYVAPRYTKTALNNGAPAKIAHATRMAQDEPEEVARRIILAIESERSELYFGFGERIFTLINAWFPKLIDLGLRGQLAQMRAITKPMAIQGL